MKLETIMKKTRHIKAERQELKPFLKEFVKAEMIENLKSNSTKTYIVVQAPGDLSAGGL